MSCSSLALESAVVPEVLLEAGSRDLNLGQACGPPLCSLVIDGEGLFVTMQEGSLPLESATPIC